MINQWIESYLDLRILRNGFFCCSLGVLLLIPADLISQSLKSNSHLVDSRLKRSGMTQGGDTRMTKNESKPLEPLSSYEEAFQKSSLFGLFNQQTNLPVFKSSIQELTKDLRLKGIVVLDQAEAIIEDARTQKSTFLKQGDQIGELTVKEIKDGAVVLSYYGEEKEMKFQ